MLQCRLTWSIRRCGGLSRTLVSHLRGSMLKKWGPTFLWWLVWRQRVFEDVLDNFGKVPSPHFWPPSKSNVQDLVSVRSFPSSLSLDLRHYSLLWSALSSFALFFLLHRLLCARHPLTMAQRISIMDVAEKEDVALSDPFNAPANIICMSLSAWEDGRAWVS
ncbi:hypothetical protein AMTRI_Chr08g206530 [Amborella trichopoda]